MLSLTETDIIEALVCSYILDVKKRKVVQNTGQ